MLQCKIFNIQLSGRISQHIIFLGTYEYAQKLVSFFLLGFSSLVYCLWERPVANIIKLFECNLRHQMPFPYDFDWGYADSDVITSKKFYNIGHQSLFREY